MDDPPRIEKRAIGSTISSPKGTRQPRSVLEITFRQRDTVAEPPQNLNCFQPVFLLWCYGNEARSLGPRVPEAALLDDVRRFMNADLRQRTDEVLNRLTQLRDSL